MMEKEKKKKKKAKKKENDFSVFQIDSIENIIYNYGDLN